MPSQRLQALLDSLIWDVTSQKRERLEGFPTPEPIKPHEYKLPSKIVWCDKGLDDQDLADLVDFLHQTAIFTLDDGQTIQLGKRWGDNLVELNLSNIYGSESPLPQNIFKHFRIHPQKSALYRTPGLDKLRVVNIANTNTVSLDLELPKMTQLFAYDNKITDLRAISPELESVDALNNPLVTLVVSTENLAILVCNLENLDSISLARLSKVCRPEHAQSSGVTIIDFIPFNELTASKVWEECSQEDKRRIIAKLNTGCITEKSISLHLYNRLNQYIKEQWLTDLLSIVAIYMHFSRTNRKVEATPPIKDIDLKNFHFSMQRLPDEINLRILTLFTMPSMWFAELHRILEKASTDLQLDQKTTQPAIARVATQMQAHALRTVTKLVKSKTERPFTRATLQLAPLYKPVKAPILPAVDCETLLTDGDPSPEQSLCSQSNSSHISARFRC